MIYQMISLNVAVNSYDHALLTLLVSNQFVEIKGSVFKKFEKDNLFQITCAGTLTYCISLNSFVEMLKYSFGLDIVERFTLFLMLVVVAFRNLIELSGSSFNFSEGFALPKSFGWFHGKNTLWIISYVSSHAGRRTLNRALINVIACDRCYGFRNACGLAQARIHRQVQPYQTFCV